MNQRAKDTTSQKDQQHYSQESMPSGHTSGATREGVQCKDKSSKDLTEAGKKDEKSKMTPPYVLSRVF